MFRPALLALVALLGCAEALQQRRVDAAVAPSAAQPWIPPQRPAPNPPAAADAALLAQLPAPGTPLTVRQLLSFAIANSAQTRAAWLQARAAAAGAQSKRAAYYPTLDVGGQAGYQHQTLGRGQFTFDQWNGTPSAALTWLVLDLGGRAADVDEADRTLEAANLAHDVALQDLVLRVEQAYFQYLGAKALLAASQATVTEAEKAYQAAEERRRAGVATVADVLQAKTQLSQARFAFQTTEGNVGVVRGALATSLGVPANLPVDVGELPRDLPVKPLGEVVDRLIEKAESLRPDLARARAQALAAASHAESIRSRGLPTLVLNGNAARNYFLDICCAHGDNYGASVLLRIPVFNGFRDTSDLLQAREQARAAQAQAESLEQQVILQVWSSYQSVKTAERRVGTAQDLLASAQQSAEVAAGRYKTGVGSILDLLTAQAALANARAQDVQARADWLLSLASLAHDTGTLSLTGEEVGQ